MYAFSLKPTGRKVDPDAAPPPPTHTIRAPAELAPPPSQDDVDEEENINSGHAQRLSPLRADSSTTSTSSPPPPQQEQQQSQLSSSAEHASAAHPPLQVHNVSAYTDMRDAADWSAVVQREKAEKRQRALAAHDAAKKEEQRRREAAEAQSRREVQRRREERQQHRAALKEADDMGDFQDRNTQFLKNQQRLIDLGLGVAAAETQRKARAREEMYKTWTTTRAGATAPLYEKTRNDTTTRRGGEQSWASTAISSSPAPGSARAGPPTAAQTTTGTTVPTTTTMTTTTRSTARAAPSREAELRQAAVATEDAYVQLSLAYRNEALRSRAAASILAAADTRKAGHAMPQPSSHTPALLSSSSSTSFHGPASLAPLPFRTAPPMYSHDSTQHMGRHANEIPMTYIPAYFEDGRAAATGQHEVRSGGTALPATTAPRHEEVMPLPLRPAPTSQAVSDTLREVYYPWVTLADGQTGSGRGEGASRTAHAPPREAYLPVERWGAADLKASVYGHYNHPDGTLQAPCERRMEFAAELNYTTIPRDNATALTNAPETIEPFRSGKRQEVWL